MNEPAEMLRKKIDSREARIAILGMGYVGLPLALTFCSQGFPVTGIDTNGERVRKIQEGESYITDVSSEALGDMVSTRRLTAVQDFTCLLQADAVCICVPTPLRKTKDPDISHIIQATEKVSQCLHRG